jgi:hypothetical protein|tara:strand:+ start:215 stop:415 length:201 start_codon:yes stop_codon:yes gene_type:complete
MSELDVKLNDTKSIVDFYSEIFIASYLKSISHDSISDKDLETAALQAQRIANVATRIRANVKIVKT